MAFYSKNIREFMEDIIQVKSYNVPHAYFS